ncbi:MAG TPA: hypothetical protein VNC61_15145 [Acidimicrobiales bacterium]|nr:hypothetical protein [Acidimicrobiales bacterium]
MSEEQYLLDNRTATVGDRRRRFYALSALFDPSTFKHLVGHLANVARGRLDPAQSPMTRAWGRRP